MEHLKIIKSRVVFEAIIKLLLPSKSAHCRGKEAFHESILGTLNLFFTSKRLKTAIETKNKNLMNGLLKPSSFRKKAHLIQDDAASKL